jgi:hypothetical protein
MIKNKPPIAINAMPIVCMVSFMFIKVTPRAMTTIEINRLLFDVFFIV